MMVFRATGTRRFKLRVVALDGRSATCSTGTDALATARDVEAFVKRLRSRRNARALAAIVGKRLTLAAAYDADVAGRLEAALDALDDADLGALVAAWAAGGAPARYVTQVRRMIPEGAPYPASSFTRGAVKGFLSGLPVSAQTKNRYRVALSQFARWLIETEVLDGNPVRDVRAAKVPARPIVYLDPADVRRLVDALAGESRVLEALMAGTGMEWGACRRLRRADVDVDARLVYARGTKNEYRDRWVEVSEDWTWAIVLPHVRALAPSAPVFTIGERAALAAHHEAAAALGLRHTWLHHHRHSFAVLWIKRAGGDVARLQWLKNQLGHAPQSTLIHTLYGVFINAARLTDAQRARGAQ